MDSDAPVTESAESGDAVGSEAPRPVVLIVDDERDLADTYARWLDGRYEVRTAYGGHEALESLDGDIDVVLLDRRMPRVTGDEVLERIREREIDCQVSMLTAVKPDAELAELGFDEYLVKPVTKANLVEVVNELLLRSSLTEETQEYLALKSAADAMTAYEGEGGPDPESVAALRERAEEVGTDPEVQEESAELQRLKQLSGLVRSVNRTVVDVDSRAELERRLCEQFVDIEPYEHALVGEYTPAYDEFIPAATDEGEPDLDPVTCEPGTALHGALTEDEVRVTDDVAAAGGVGELRTAIDDKPAPESAVVVPVTYGGAVHSGVVLWASEPVTLDDRERTVLTEVGTTLGNALDSLRTKEMVHADRIVQLELAVGDRTDVFVDLAAKLDCRVALEGLNLSSAAGIVCYLTVTTEQPEEALTFLAASDGVANCRPVDDRGGDVLVECTVEGDSILLDLLDANANVTEFFVDGGRGQVSVELPTSVDLRTVLEDLQGTFPDVDLRSKRTTDRSYQSVEGFRASLSEELTDRQNATIEAAYNAGYFDWPRESTAEEVAQGLGMAPPTFHEHLREAERKLAGIYLEETE